VTVNGVAQSLPRTTSGSNQSEYTTADGLYKLKISSSYGKRNRRVVRLEQSKVAADPFASGLNKQYSMSTFLVIDTPPTGYTNTELGYIIQALVAWLSSANVAKVLGGES